MTTSSVPPQPATGPKDGVASTYARNATGLVREIPVKDMIAFNAASTTPLGAGLAIGVFFAFVVFPGANIILDFVIAVAIGGFVWATFALMSAAMPRTGGDYLYASRVLHPAIGLGSNFVTWLAAILAAGVWAYWLTQIGIAPMLGTIGTLTGSQGWIDAAGSLSGKTTTFLIAAGLIIFLSVVSALGTKAAVRAMTWFYGLAFVGFVVSMGVLLFTSHGHFVDSFNDFAKPFTGEANTYSGVVEAGKEEGLHYSSEGYSFKNTLAALGVTLGTTLWVWWGVYMAGEMKGAGRRRRQLTAIFAAGYGQGILLILGAVLVLATIGGDFLTSATAGFFPIENTQPYYNVFASIVTGSNVIGVILSLLFILWFVPGCFANLAMGQRVPFAWSFDGLAPKALASVNDRTHTPVISIAVTCVLSIAAAAWATYSTNFFVVFATLAVFSIVPIITTGICAIALPWRRPEIYRGSEAEWRVAGVPVLTVAGIGCALVGLLDMTLYLAFHTNYGVGDWWLLLLPPIGCFAAGVVYYFAARAVRAAKGVNVDLVYQTIPPD